MKNNIAISVIIPMRNIQGYIAASLNSLKSQTLSQNLFEVVLIDDGSIDNTFTIAKSFKGIKNLTIDKLKKNSGPGIARNRGIELSKGDYILFLDGDDYFLGDSLEKLFTIINNNNVDVVTFNWTYHKDLIANNPIPRRRDLDGMPVDRLHLTKHYLGMNMDGSVIYTLVKKSVLVKNSIKFPSGFHADMSIIFQIYYSARNILKLNEIIYIKRDRADSIIHTFSKRHVDGYLNAWPKIMDFLIENEGDVAKDKFIQDYLRGISGLAASLITTNLKVNSEDFNERLELYKYIVKKLKDDRYLVDIKMLPNLTKKDQITQSFCKSMSSKDFPIEKEVELFEKKISMKKSWSCSSLHYSIFAGPDVLRHCCKRFFVDGQMRGDVEIFKVSSNSDLSSEKILEHKQKLYEDINSGKETPCSGCPWLKHDQWESFNKLKIKHLSIENHTVCNLRCTYCDGTYYGGKKSNYDIMYLYKELKSKDTFDENTSLVWGGGEPLLLDSFCEVFSTLTQELAPSHNNIFTNAVIYSDCIAKYLKEGKVTITASIDAGFRSTYNKIKGSDKLTTALQNLEKYHQCGKDRITIKYLLLQENYKEDEVLAFVEKIKKYGLTGCSFQISTSYKIEQIDEKIAKAAIFLFNQLKKHGAKLINFDDHLRPRLNSIRDSLNIKSGYSDKDVMIWGAGDYAEMMLKESSFFKDRNIRCFVDSSRQRHGKKFGLYEIKPPKAVLENEDTYIFIASTIYYREIYNQILDMGVSPKRIIDSVVV